MEVAEIIRWVADLGVMVVVCGIFLFLAFRMFNKQQDWLEQFIKGTDNNTKKGDHPSKEASENLNIINRKIYQELQGLRNALNADRTYAVLYHNGGKSSSGLYFQKMSCICEITHSGISPLSREFQGIHRGSYSYMLDRLNSEDEVLVDDVSSIEYEDAFSYSQLEHRHVLSVYMKSLKDIDGTPIGFIGIDYCSKNTDIPSDKIAQLLKTVSHKISSLVDIRDEVS